MSGFRALGRFGLLPWRWASGRLSTGTGTELGNNDAAFVFDPGGPLGSSADAGSTLTAAGSSDLASVFGDNLHAALLGVSNQFEFLPALFGDGTGSFAADSSNFLADLLPGLGSGAADSAGNFLTDIFSGSPSKVPFYLPVRGHRQQYDGDRGPLGWANRVSVFLQ